MEREMPLHFIIPLSPQESSNWQIQSDFDSLIFWINNTSFLRFKKVAPMKGCSDVRYASTTQTMPDTEELSGPVTRALSQCCHHLGKAKQLQSATQSPDPTSGPRLVKKDAKSRSWKAACPGESQTPSAGMTLAGILSPGRTQVEIRSTHVRGPQRLCGGGRRAIKQTQSYRQTTHTERELGREHRAPRVTQAHDQCVQT